ncbi:neutral/alkaline non-lysosomal ceramidase N-terminal domain-containing protein [Halobacteria archaeon AArc-curdl1]|uniref:Neutral/alkaline non-lysosomal ceramidase N-terminal domain-containing protein n=1 Tax=Natronosalvus hydrolyticus TaxID=2979988 RepID=A0AAP2Z6T3_9EURY|nr:neutral/alkaline non-lysosomal ceramidase N-terminal domain-containing protein [Halobacteria archaeon AArc-curdl1]
MANPPYRHGAETRTTADGLDRSADLRCDGGTIPPAWRVGTATVDITPDETEPHRLIGFGARDGHMDGVEHDISARAVAFEDRTGQRLVFLSFELLFVFETQRAYLEAECAKRWGLEPKALVINPSHTHYGPDYDVHREGLQEDYDRDDDLVAEYREFVDERLLEVIGAALEDFEPASLSYYHAKLAIAMNRRRATEDGIGFDPTPDGPVDHDLPVLAVETAGGTTKALLFGYACHPTAGMAFSNEVNGDWPGYAMEYLEETYPDATAVFVIGCAGDQKAYPQGSRQLVKGHARTAATAVERALVTEPKPVRGPLKLAAGSVTLDIENPIEDENGDQTGGTEVTGHRPYPIQAVGFGTDLTLLSLSGEVVADFALELKETLASPLWVAGYANNTGYLPTKRILAEGGYESWQSFEDGLYAPSTAERILDKSVALAERVGARRREL